MTCTADQWQPDIRWCLSCRTVATVGRVGCSSPCTFATAFSNIRNVASHDFTPGHREQRDIESLSSSSSMPVGILSRKKEDEHDLALSRDLGSGGCAARGRQHHHTVHKRLLGPHHAKRCCERKVVFMNAAFKSSITRGQNYFTRLSLIMNLFSIYKPLLRLADPVTYSIVHLHQQLEPRVGKLCWLPVSSARANNLGVRRHMSTPRDPLPFTMPSQTLSERAYGLVRLFFIFSGLALLAVTAYLADRLGRRHPEQILKPNIAAASISIVADALAVVLFLQQRCRVFIAVVILDIGSIVAACLGIPAVLSSANRYAGDVSPRHKRWRASDLIVLGLTILVLCVPSRRSRCEGEPRLSDRVLGGVRETPAFSVAFSIPASEFDATKRLEAHGPVALGKSEPYVTCLILLLSKLASALAYAGSASSIDSGAGRNPKARQWHCLTSPYYGMYGFACTSVKWVRYQGISLAFDFQRLAYRNTKSREAPRLRGPLHGLGLSPATIHPRLSRSSFMYSEEAQEPLKDAWFVNNAELGAWSQRRKNDRRRLLVDAHRTSNKLNVVLSQAIFHDTP
ncbi:hypothetical protein Purlil1_12243 [Purpureocillium lilacinum]|uniref:Uncharacterized protein n=1 Tax=Purpureocillium lilacinum TaxID=33203 RepID=A0ABR0BHE3_PURLI|nr:hypothetical protein Purlil1_12243 [Purpureocillium lilacinum]